MQRILRKSPVSHFELSKPKDTYNLRAEEVLAGRQGGGDLHAVLALVGVDNIGSPLLRGRV